ncbi:MAG: Uma2 family endonuclease [Dehalococcoidia bacterium]|nr:Uma2 family endonuclease [Dehalococcoidia bacterium]
MTQLSEPPATGARRVTYEEFLCGDFPAHSEWVDGEVVPMVGVSGLHNEMGAFLIELLRGFLQATNIGRLRYEPFQMKPAPDQPGRSPDLMVILNEHLHRLHDLYLEGAADVVVEIVSPGTEAVDRGTKFYEYEAGGVPEYWLIDPHRETAEFFVRDDAGHYRPTTLEGTVFRSTVLPGFWLRTEWLWQRPATAGLLGGDASA